jgi:hypothetical protein
MTLPLSCFDLLKFSTGRPGNRSFLEQIKTQVEPTSDFARYFREVNQRLLDLDLTARLVAPEELAWINDVNRDTWPPLISVVDHRAFPPAANEMQCLACYDRDGIAVATSAVRRFDLTHSNVAAELTSLRLLFGPRADAMSSTVEFILTAPSAAQIKGQILYHGGVWVHPRLRKSGITRIVPKLNRYIALAREPFDYEIALASAAVLKPHVAASYATEGSEPYYAYKSDGITRWEGVFNWLSRDWIVATLQTDLAALHLTSSREHISRDKQQPAAIAFDR